MGKTLIEWCDYSASAWEGCTKVSPGCLNCYAERRDRRHLIEKVDHWGKGAPRRIVASYEDKIRAWNRMAAGATRRPTVFASVMDPFDLEVPVQEVEKSLRVIQENQNLIFLLLTKRPENWRWQLLRANRYNNGFNAALHEFLVGWSDGDRVPSNVWIGTSCENQEWAAKRIPHMLKIPTVGRFLSVEPMLGPVDLTHIDADAAEHPDLCQIDALTGRHTDMGRPCQDVPKIDWVIYGGESGPGARPCNVDWIKDGVRQCKAAGVAPFVKQLGADPTFNAPSRIEDWGQEHISKGAWISAMKHPKGGEPSEWPEELRVREFPEGLR